MRTKNIEFVLFMIIFLICCIHCDNEKSPTTNSSENDTLIDTGLDTVIDTIVDTTGDTTIDTTIDSTQIGSAIIADHTVIPNYDLISDSLISEIINTYSIFYGHTSHGSQIRTGLQMLYLENSRYTIPSMHEIGDDLGANGDTTWVPITRNWLNANPSYNMVIWSWCGGVSISSEAEINVYLNAMNQLENEYPNVLFVYMTGHLDGTGENGNLRTRNRQIRQYCLDNDKILYDFEDIESYDPAGNYYPDETDACGWCTDWCSTHTCMTCSSCAHSHCFNCYQKGKAFWCLLSAIKSAN